MLWRLTAGNKFCLRSRIIDLCRWRFIENAFGHFSVGIFKLQKLFLRYVAIVADPDIGHVSDSLSKVLYILYFAQSAATAHHNSNIQKIQ